MSYHRQCNVCLEPFKREVNPPYSCNPCGHVTCKPCLDTWFTSNSKRCPECRTRVTSITINRGLMNVIEEDQQTRKKTCEPSNNEDCQSGTYRVSGRNINSIIRDGCDYAIYLIDNSQRVKHNLEGKIYTLHKNTWSSNSNSNSKVTLYENVLSWKEIVSRVLQIAAYNIKINRKAIYYLINPVHPLSWEPDQDYLIVNPSNIIDINATMRYLEMNLLNINNISGELGLDNMISYLSQPGKCLPGSQGKPICLNLITANLPNRQLNFSRQLNVLLRKHSIFWVTNICSNYQRVDNYYQTLSYKIKDYLVGYDIVNNFGDEADKIWNLGNTFFTYNLGIHICRMAGCHSILIDKMSTQELTPYYANLLISELTKYQGLTNGGLSDKYCRQVTYLNSVHPLVYNIRSREFSPIINILRLYLLQYFYPIKQKIGLINTTVVEFLQGTMVIISLLLMIFY